MRENVRQRRATPLRTSATQSIRFAVRLATDACLKHCAQHSNILTHSRILLVGSRCCLFIEQGKASEGASTDQVLGEITTTQIHTAIQITQQFRECVPCYQTLIHSVRETCWSKGSCVAAFFVEVRHCCAEFTPSGSITSSNSGAKLHAQHRTTLQSRAISMALRHGICLVPPRVDVHQISVVLLHRVLRTHVFPQDALHPSQTTLVWTCLRLTVDMVHKSDTVAEFTHEVFRHHPFGNPSRLCEQFCFERPQAH